MEASLPPQIVIQTQSEGKRYNFFPLVKSTLEFKIKSSNDNYICLTPSYTFNGPRHYEINIGGWDNSKSILQKDVANNFLDTHLGSIIDEGTFNTFWVKIDKSKKTIEVGKGEKDTEPFLKAIDPDFVEMEYFGISSKNSAAGEWFMDADIVVNNITRSPPPQIGMPVSVCSPLNAFLETQSKNTRYNFFPLVKSTLEFKVKSSNDNYICLTPSFMFNGPRHYEINIGGWDNTKSIIQKDVANNFIDIHMGRIIDTGKFNVFWVRIDKTNKTIEVGKGEKDTEPFLKAVDPDFVEMEYFGISSKNNAAGEWIMDRDIIVP